MVLAIVEVDASVTWLAEITKTDVVFDPGWHYRDTVQQRATKVPPASPASPLILCRAVLAPLDLRFAILPLSPPQTAALLNSGRCKLDCPLASWQRAGPNQCRGSMPCCSLSHTCAVHFVLSSSLAADVIFSPCARAEKGLSASETDATLSQTARTTRLAVRPILRHAVMLCGSRCAASQACAHHARAGGHACGSVWVCSGHVPLRETAVAQPRRRGRAR
eukprot:2360574-Rhodomonas_salina.3